jgi:hypothetical protein
MNSCKGVLVVVLLVIGVTGLWPVTGGDTMATIDEYVLIDGRESAYTLFIRVPKASLEKIQASMGQEKIDTETWAEFQTGLAKYVRRCIIKNEYPEYSAIAIQKGLLAFLNAFPGAPIGLTWNGGIAMTYGDYQYAQKSIKKYLDNKDQYESARHSDPKTDPLNPGAHFEALLGHSFLDR